MLAALYTAKTVPDPLVTQAPGGNLTQGLPSWKSGP